MELLRRTATYLEWTFVSLITILSAARYATPSAYGDLLQALIRFLASWTFPLVIYLAAGSLILKIVQDWAGRRLARKAAIKHVLDMIHKTYFMDRPAAERYQHRVTLFKASRWFSRTPRYLQIFSRSGSIRLKSKTWLPIDPEHDEGNQGVGAWAWYTDAQIVRQDLPEWPENPNPNFTDDPTCQEYARRGLMSPELVATVGIKSLSFAATVVRDRAGRKWGALVLDSRDPRGISDSPDKNALVALCADLLTPILRGGS